MASYGPVPALSGSYPPPFEPCKQDFSKLTYFFSWREFWPRLAII